MKFEHHYEMFKNKTNALQDSNGYKILMLFCWYF